MRSVSARDRVGRPRKSALVLALLLSLVDAFAQAIDAPFGLDKRLP